MTQDIARDIARAALEIKAIKLQPRDPFTWTSGYRMPIYNDNRRLLSNYENRALVAQGFAKLIKEDNLPCDVIAGTATAGISPGTTLADLMKSRFCYVRSEAKGHGTKSKVEGIINPGDKALLVEDLISTGGSSIAAVVGLRETGAVVENCLAIFSYGFEKAKQAFADEKCRLHVLLTFEALVKAAAEINYITAEDEKLLASWHEDPFTWGERHGFPKVEK